jgi:hypothetical protein
MIDSGKKNGCMVAKCNYTAIQHLSLTTQNRPLEVDKNVSSASKKQNLSAVETLGNPSQTVENTFQYPPLLERDTALATTDFLTFLPIKTMH